MVKISRNRKILTTPPYPKKYPPISEGMRKKMGVGADPYGTQKVKPPPPILKKIWRSANKQESYLLLICTCHLLQ